MNQFELQHSRFASTAERLEATDRRHTGFPKEAAAVVRMIKLIHKLTVDHGNDTLRVHGLSYPEYNVLMMIDSSPDGALSPSLIGEAAGEKSANVTRLTQQLVDKGLIQRQPSPQDRRSTLLCLTQAGHASIAAFLPDIWAVLKGYVRDLDRTEQAALRHLLTKLLHGVEQTL